MAKVYITTHAVPFGPERLDRAFSTRKAAEKALRKEYPHMKKSNDMGNFTSYVTDNSMSKLVFIHEMDID